MLKQTRLISKASDAPPRMTYAEFLQRTDGEHVEWVDGKAVAMAPVSNEHSAIQVLLVTLLNTYAAAFDLGEVRAEPFQMKTGQGLPGRSPDVIFIAKRNLARLKKSHLEGPADLVVEVISPGSQSIDRGDKYYEYEKGGVREYWLLDPVRRQAEFYVLGKDGVYNLARIDDGTYRSTAMKGLWLKVAWLWQKPLPSILDILKAWKIDR